MCLISSCVLGLMAQKQWAHRRCSQPPHRTTKTQQTCCFSSILVSAQFLQNSHDVPPCIRTGEVMLLSNDSDLLLSEGRKCWILLTLLLQHTECPATSPLSSGLWGWEVDRHGISPRARDLTCPGPALRGDAVGEAPEGGSTLLGDASCRHGAAQWPPLASVSTEHALSHTHVVAASSPPGSPLPTGPHTLSVLVDPSDTSFNAHLLEFSISV